METIKFFRLFSSFFMLSFLSFSAYALNSGGYAQLSSSQNQSANGPVNLAFIDKVDSLQNMSSTQNKVIVKADGIYFVMAAGQIGAIKKGVVDNGYVDLWLVQNGKVVANSNTRLTVNNAATGVLVSQTLMPLKAGDTISVGFSASDPSLGLVTIPATNGEPAIPSIIFSMHKV